MRRSSRVEGGMREDRNRRVRERGGGSGMRKRERERGKVKSKRGRECERGVREEVAKDGREGGVG